MRLQGLISRPILDLAGLVRKVSETHDYSLRARKEGEDEIGSLADGVNEMLSRIQERELERDLADRRTREKSRFLANMSHELRTPLNSIIGFSEVLISRLQDRVPAKDLKFLRNIHGSGQHLLAVVNDILDISKVEAGTMEVRPAALSVRAVIEGVRQVMKGLSARRSVAVAVEVPDDLPPLEADPEKLKQVLYHLLSNAVKFSPFGGTVTLRARLLAAEASPLGEEAVAISVADQGPGIDPRDHELIFQEFRQVESGSPIEGSGLGLSIVKKFVELHGGRVTVDSALGRGATFTAVLPRRFRSRGTASGAPPGAAAAGAS
jgi:signal transduction histidine kinase